MVLGGSSKAASRLFRPCAPAPSGSSLAATALATTNVPDLTGTAFALALSASTLGYTLVGGLVGDHIPKPAALASCTAVQEVAWAEE